MNLWQKLLTAILLLLFSLKMGNGLLLHELFHSSSETEQAGKMADVDYACHCIDDFLTPINEQETITTEFVAHYTPVRLALMQSYPCVRPTSTPPFRGPPACV